MPNRVDNEFFVVDTSYLINEARKKQACKLIISGNHDLHKAFFQANKDFSFVTHLIIQGKAFSEMLMVKLRCMMLANLEHLEIIVDILQNPCHFIDELGFYSNLKLLKVQAKEFKQGWFDVNGTDNNSTEISQYIEKKCNEITALNKELKFFIQQDFETIKDKLNRITFDSSNNLIKFSNDDLVFLIELGKNYNTYDKYYKHQKFNKALIKDEDFNRLINISYNWNMFTICANNDSKKFEILIPFFSNYFNLNEIFSHNHIEQRLIDISVSNQHLLIVRLLVQQEVNLTRYYRAEESPLSGNRNYISQDKKNFPFYMAHAANNKEILEIFIKNEFALYDALAWYICFDCRADFNDIAGKISLDVLKPIPSGAFEGFNLISLVVYYNRKDLFSKIVDAFDVQQLINVANQTFSDNEFFKFKNWSILSFLLYKWQYDEIALLTSNTTDFDVFDLKYETIIHVIDSDKVISSHYYALVLILIGAEVIIHLNKENKWKEMIKCFEFISNKYITDCSILSLCINRDNEFIPLLHYAIQNRTYFLIDKYVNEGPNEYINNKLKRKTEITIYNNSGKRTGNFCALQVACYLGEDDSIASLFKAYIRYNLLHLILERETQLYNLNLFEYALVTDNAIFLKQLLLWENCPINNPFPDDHPYYSGWLPIHIAILKAFSANGSLLLLLLERNDLDISIPYPESGIPNYIAGHYPLSAIFYFQYPLKDSKFTSRIIVSYFNNFLHLIEKLPINSKQYILDDTLYHAVLFHNKKTGHDYSTYITRLVEIGANPNRPVETSDSVNNYRIIDMALARGIGHLFPRHLLSINNKLAKQTIMKTVQRFSELKPCTYVNEEHYSVVSLVRDKNSSHSEHVFIIVEQIIDGLYYMHFADFVQNLSNPGKGKVRYDKKSGHINESILSRCTLSLLKELDLNNLISRSWQLTNDTANKLIDNIMFDEARNYNNPINYITVGSRSFLGKSSSKKGHNCYTWARERLFTTESPDITRALKPTLEEWLATIPSFKDGPFYKNKYFFFFATAASVACLSAAVGKLIY